ncbi:MAG TPA: elongation factor P, partial [Candidatus Aveggerthella excrementigallinarum]|nr:elongation factor P [Candidatus Aveggerthella excrementigallinarum]
MAISTADFKNGMCIMNNGKMCTIVEFQHVKPGKGGAFVRTKLRDIKTGRVVDYTFNAGTKFDQVRLETKKMQYLYNDGADFYFMDNDTFEQIAIPSDVVGDNAQWLKENDEASLLYADDELISIEPQM